MGNRFSARKRPGQRRSVDERFTRPQRLVCEPANVDYKKLRKLILTEKLAPCFDGVEDSNPDLEECPICFFYFPSLNRSRCCMKGICTECFLQMKPSNSTRPAQCPFCKCSIYAVEYRGAKTREEKRLEQAEEQKVIEAKIRMQSEESQDVNRATLADQISSEVGVQSPLPCVWRLPSRSSDSQDARNSQPPHAQGRSETARHEEFDVDLEEIMIAEALWQSVQDQSINQSTEPSLTGGLDSTSHGYNGCRPSFQMVDNQGEMSSSESVTGGIAFAIARFAEQTIQRSETFQTILDDHTHQTMVESSIEDYNSNISMLTTIPDEARSMNVAACVEPDDRGLITECSRSGGDDSWGSFVTHHLEVSQTSEPSFASDDDREEMSKSGSCHASSIHFISERSFRSPDCFDEDVTSSCASHSSTIAVQPSVVSDVTP